MILWILIVLCGICAVIGIAHMIATVCIDISSRRKMDAITGNDKTGSPLEKLQGMHEEYEALERELRQKEKAAFKPIAGMYRSAATRVGTHDYRVRADIARQEVKRDIQASEQQYAENPMACVTALLAVKTDEDSTAFYRHGDHYYALRKAFLDGVVPLAESGDEVARQFVIDNVKKVMDR